MIYKSLAGMTLALLLLTGIALGGLDQSGGARASNLSITDFNSLGIEGTAEGMVADAGAPQATATGPGMDLAVYTQAAPSGAELDKLLPSQTLSNPPNYMYYNGDYLAWNDFSATFSGNRPGLWIERAVSWSMYATMPLGAWARELLYVPAASTLTMYEIYPAGFVREYLLGSVQPGYYYIWYYADTPGRHLNVLVTGDDYSNSVIIDVYGLPVFTPPSPSPKEQCESNSLCHYVNGNCLCTGFIEDPKKKRCEENPDCDYVNGHCYCRGLDPEDPEKQKCEENSNCDYVNGHCYCRGLDPEPMPGPVPNPEPDPEPFHPASNPVAECESNPSCHYANGRCNCMGLGMSGDAGNGEDDIGLGAEASY